MPPFLILLLTIFYVCIALSFALEGRYGMGLMFAGYVVANVGLYMEIAK